MNALVPKTDQTDPKRQAMLAAAQAYDDLQRELGSLRDQLHTAVAGLESKNSEIVELRKVLEYQRQEFTRQLTEERDNVRVANLARDQAYNDRSEALSWLANIEAIIDRAKEGGLPAPKRRNGKHPAPVGPGDVGGHAVPDASAGPA